MPERAPVLCIVCHNMAFTEELVFVYRKTVKTYRSSGMYFICADTNLCPETVSETIAETG